MLSQVQPDTLYLVDMDALATQMENQCNEPTSQATLYDSAGRYGSAKKVQISGSYNESQGPLCCRGYRGCYSSDILAGGDVLCQGSNSCEYSNIEAAGDVLCVGGHACIFGWVKTSAVIYCS